MKSVDLKMNTKWEGLDYHHFLWQRCYHRIAVRRLWIQAGVLEHESEIKVEYHTGQQATESLIALKMIKLWIGNVTEPEFKCRFQFEDGNEAMLFKLTFGGV